MSVDAMKQMVDALRHSIGYVGVDVEAKCISAIEVGLDAIAKAEKEKPIAYIHRNEYNEYRLEPHDDFKINSIPVGVDVNLFKEVA